MCTHAHVSLGIGKATDNLIKKITVFTAGLPEVRQENGDVAASRKRGVDEDRLLDDIDTILGDRFNNSKYNKLVL